MKTLIRFPYGNSTLSLLKLLNGIKRILINFEGQEKHNFLYNNKQILFSL